MMRLLWLIKAKYYSRPTTPINLMKIYVLADSISGYSLKWRVYTGKDSTRRFATTTEEIVLELLDEYLGLDHNVYMDSYSTSYKLFERRPAEGLGAVGTVRLNRLG